jgi:hypothetical protein
MEARCHVGGRQVLRDFYLEFQKVASKTLTDFCNSVVKKIGALVAVNEDGKKTQIEPFTISLILTTIVPTIFNWVKQCRDLKQDKSVQPSVAEVHNGRKAEQQREQLAKRILVELKKLQVAEKRAAKAERRPADLGRFALDKPAALRVADKSISEFVSMGPESAAAMVGECCAMTGA